MQEATHAAPARQRGKARRGLRAPWHAVWAPKGSPKAAVDKLNAAISAALNDQATRQRLVDLGQEVVEPAQRSPQALSTFHKAEIDKWSPLIKAEKLSAQ